MLTTPLSRSSSACWARYGAWLPVEPPRDPPRPGRDVVSLTTIVKIILLGFALRHAAVKCRRSPNGFFGKVAKPGGLCV